MAPYRVHRLIQGLFKVPGLLERLGTDASAVFDEYGLAESERQALADGSPEALGRLGVHPILQMHYMLARDPAMAAQITIRAYADQLGRP
jgi:2'-aminobiphenyl-2,3-diol 1,2-dioxygenase, small subunit